MNKKQLEYFMETYHYRNIQAAADNLYISHQGLSRVIRSLEDELGQALFVRSNRGLEPTDFATTLLNDIFRASWIPMPGLRAYRPWQGRKSLLSRSTPWIMFWAIWGQSLYCVSTKNIQTSR